MNNTPYKIPR